MKSKILHASVIICSFNGGERIGDCLSSLNAQTYGKNNFEIIVIDDGSTDNTSSIADKYGTHLIRFEINKGIPIARNAGMYVARGEIIVFVDDDCIADTFWLENLISMFHDKTVVAAGGKILPISNATIAQRYLEATGYGNPNQVYSINRYNIITRFAGYFRTMLFPTILMSEPMDVLAIYTSNAAYRKEALVYIGGFDKSLLTSEDEDVSEQLRISKLGRILYVPSAVVKHRHYERLSKVIHQPYYRSKNTLKFYLKYKRIPPLFPMPVLYVLLIIWLAMVFNIIMVIIALILLPIALYCWWIIRAIREMRLEYVLYPYIQLAVESAVIVGLLKGLLSIVLGIAHPLAHIKNTNKL